MKSPRTSQLAFGFEPPEEVAPRVTLAAPPPPPGKPSGPRVTSAGARATSSAREASARSVEHLAGELRLLVGAPIALHVHDNRSTMVSFRRDDGAMQLRVHHMFLAAGPDVVRALAEYARARSVRAGKVLDQFVRQNRGHIKPVDVERARQRPLQATGEVHELQELFDHLNARYFGEAIAARIGWGRGSSAGRRRSIRMGAYFHDTRTILIHPALDRAEVPRYFVGLVVYHEMLHQAVPQRRDETGRRCIHSAEFRAREELHVDYERAREWERHNLAILLQPARATKPRT